MPAVEALAGEEVRRRAAGAAGPVVAKEAERQVGAAAAQVEVLPPETPARARAVLPGQE